MAPRKIQLHKKSKELELQFDADSYRLAAEFLRVHSPSAEVKGHGPGQHVLQHGKKEVGIRHIEMAGNYALKIVFDDGHDSGIYTWNYLHDLCVNQEKYWSEYLEALHNAGKAREPHTAVVRFIE